MPNKLWIAALALAIAPAAAQTPLERGKYLVEGILTCGNCHTPRGPETGARSSPACIAPSDTADTTNDAQSTRMASGASLAFPSARSDRLTTDGRKEP